jgi:hypothetical protein
MIRGWKKRFGGWSGRSAGCARRTAIPPKARAFLIRAGIAEKVRKSKKYPTGVRLAK